MLFYMFFSFSPSHFHLKPRSSDKKSELLPADWSVNKELYSLRYKSSDSDTQLLLKAIVVDSTLIFNLMVGTALTPLHVCGSSDHMSQVFCLPVRHCR